MQVGGRVVAEDAQYPGSAGQHSRIEVALAELRRDVAFDDDAAGRVGESSLQPVTDFDAHLPLVRRDDENRAGVLALLPDAPGAAELVTVILDRMPLH